MAINHNGLRIGLIGESSIEVTQAHTAKAMGSGSLDVFSTPSMLALMESAAVRAIDPYLKEGYASVGIEANVRHLSATPCGETVTALAEITRIDQGRIHVEVRAWDQSELIGSGTHIRYVIEKESFLARLERKSD